MTAVGFPKKPPRTQYRRAPILAYVTMAIVAVFALGPVAWMSFTAFSTAAYIFSFPPSLDRTYTLEHFLSVLTNTTLLRYMLNGLGVSALTTLSSLTVAFLAGYSFSKFRYVGRAPAMYSILLAQMVPEILLLLTLYTSFDSLGLLNTYAALILAYTTFTLPLSVWMMKNTFDAIPDELIEAAKIDGASEATIMSSILFPVVRTPLIAIGLFSFIKAWNDLAFALTLVDTDHQTLPAGLALTFLGEFVSSYGDMMAASLITSLPVVAVFFALQKQFLNTAISGSLK